MSSSSVSSTWRTTSASGLTGILAGRVPQPYRTVPRYTSALLLRYGRGGWIDIPLRLLRLVFPFGGGVTIFFRGTPLRHFAGVRRLLKIQLCRLRILLRGGSRRIHSLFFLIRSGVGIIIIAWAGTPTSMMPMSTAMALPVLFLLAHPLLHLLVHRRCRILQLLLCCCWNRCSSSGGRRRAFAFNTASSSSRSTFLFVAFSISW